MRLCVELAEVHAHVDEGESIVLVAAVEHWGLAPCDADSSRSLESIHRLEKLSARGDEKARQCGWLKNRTRLLPGERAMKAMLQMKKLDIAKLRTAHRG